MNREILFKAKRTDNLEWIYGSLCKKKDKYYITEDTDQFYQVIPKTVCQYTGLKDKNGVKIFENDKVKYDYKFSEKTGIITYNQENASWQIKGIPSSSMKHHNKLIKLGNIFDEEVK